MTKKQIAPKRKKLSTVYEAENINSIKHSNPTSLKIHTEHFPAIQSEHIPQTSAILITTRKNGSQTNTKIILPVLRDIQSQVCSRSYRRSTTTYNSLNNKRSTMLNCPNGRQLTGISESDQTEPVNSSLPRLDDTKRSSNVSNGANINRDKCYSPLLKRKGKKKQSKF